MVNETQEQNEQSELKVFSSQATRAEKWTRKINWQRIIRIEDSKGFPSKKKDKEFNLVSNRVALSSISIPSSLWKVSKFCFFKVVLYKCTCQHLF